MVLYASCFSIQTEAGEGPQLKVIIDDSIARWESGPQTGEAAEGWDELRGVRDLGVGRFSCMDSWMDGYMDVKEEECMHG